MEFAGEGADTLDFLYLRNEIKRRLIALCNFVIVIAVFIKIPWPQALRL